MLLVLDMRGWDSGFKIQPCKGVGFNVPGVRLRPY